jgi:peptide methionine sulfoxide reductase msrA/msrB
LNLQRQLVVFEAEDCAFCKQFKAEVLDHWKSEVAIVATLNPNPPSGWTLEKACSPRRPSCCSRRARKSRATPATTATRRASGSGWVSDLLTPAQQKIAFSQGTEPAFTGSHLDEKRPGTFVDPITGAPLFRSDTKFNSGTGWPSFFNPVEGSITMHEDISHGMKRVEVRSASSGIHLGHVFNDGPPPTYKRYCINGNVLKFVPDAEVAAKR